MRVTRFKGDLSHVVHINFFSIIPLFIVISCVEEESRKCDS